MAKHLAQTMIKNDDRLIGGALSGGKTITVYRDSRGQFYVMSGTEAIKEGMTAVDMCRWFLTRMDEDQGE